MRVLISVSVNNDFVGLHMPTICKQVLSEATTAIIFIEQTNFRVLSLSVYLEMLLLSCLYTMAKLAAG